MTKTKSDKKKGFSGFITQSGLLGLFALSALPLPLMHFFAKRLGSLLLFLRPRSRKIARINVRNCFPQLDEKKVNTMVRHSFHHYCLGILWTFKLLRTPVFGYGENKKNKDLKKPVRNITWQGDKKLEKMLTSRRRVIILGGHFAFMDVMGYGIGHRFPRLVCTYKKSGNVIFDNLIQKREKYMKAVIEAADVHRIRRTFVGGDLMWLTVDQDSASAPSIYADFFGVPAVSPVAGWRWAKIMNAEVFIAHAVLLANYSLKIYFHHLPGFKDMSVERAIGIQNDALAEHIKKSPSQYVWLYRRFRRQPAGRASIY